MSEVMVRILRKPASTNVVPGPGRFRIREIWRQQRRGVGQGQAGSGSGRSGRFDSSSST